MLFDCTKNPIFLFKSPINIRQNHEGLAAIIRKHFGEDFLYSGAAFVFILRNRHQAKVLFFDGTGLIVTHKKFVIKAFGHLKYIDEISKITIQELELLFSGRHITIPVKKTKSDGIDKCQKKVS